MYQRALWYICTMLRPLGNDFLSFHFATRNTNTLIRFVLCFECEFWLKREREIEIRIPFCMCTKFKAQKELVMRANGPARVCDWLCVCVCVLIASFCFFIIYRMEQRLLCIFKRNEEKKKHDIKS